LIQKTIIVTHREGIHTRPATQLVKVTSHFTSEIMLAIADETADAKSVIEIMSLAADCGQEILVTVDGEEEEAAMEAVVQFFAEGDA
jgi:phosphocarrier protein HPr